MYSFDHYHAGLSSQINICVKAKYNHFILVADPHLTQFCCPIAIKLAISFRVTSSLYLTHSCNQSISQSKKKDICYSENNFTNVHGAPVVTFTLMVTEAFSML